MTAYFSRMTAPSSALSERVTSSTEARWHTDVLLVLMAIMWGVNFSVLKFTANYMGPLAINAIRIPGAAAAQIGIAHGLRLERPTRREIWALILLGAIGNGIYQTFFIQGLARASVATAALIIASTPAFVAIAGRIHGSEFLTRAQQLGVAMQVAGCSIVAYGATRGAAGPDSGVGVLLLLCAAASWSVYAVNVKRYSDHIEPWYLGGYTMLGGAPVVLLAGGVALSRVVWSDVPSLGYAALAYSCFVAMVVAYLFYYRGLRVLGPTRTSMYSNLQPIIAMITAWLALRERPTGVQLLGAALIVGGLVAARSSTEPAEA
jgi:drug/metabolite transporter (DMT)-like permease